MEISGFASSSPVDNHDDPQRSQWLEMALSEFNEKTRSMMTFLEDGNFLAGAEIYDQRRLDFVQMLRDLNRFYSSLAEEHNLMRLQMHQTMNIGSTSSSSRTNSYKKGLEEGCDADVGSHNTDFNFENLDKPEHELMPENPCKMASQTKQEMWENQMELEEEGFSSKDYANMISKNDLLQKTAGDFLERTCERENSWSDMKLQVTKLMEENLQRQAELARRNFEKKVVINRLRLQLEQLKAENRALHNYVSCLNVREKQSRVQITKIRGPFLGKFFGGCS